MIEEIKETLSRKYFPLLEDNEEFLEKLQIVELALTSILDEKLFWADTISTSYIQYFDSDLLECPYPYISIHSSNINFDSTLSSGIFVALFWKYDGNGVCLSLQKGDVGLHKNELQKEIFNLRKSIGKSSFQNFINLAGPKGDKWSKGDEASNIFGKSYAFKELDSLKSDLFEMLGYYQEIAKDKALQNTGRRTFNCFGKFEDKFGMTFSNHDTSLLQRAMMRLESGHSENLNLVNEVSLQSEGDKSLKLALEGSMEFFREQYNRSVLLFKLDADSQESSKSQINLQLEEMAEEFRLASSETTSSIKIARSKQWMELEKDFLVLLDSPCGFSAPGERDFLPHTHKKYKIISSLDEKASDRLSKIPDQINCFLQLAFLRLILEEKSLVNENRDWQLLFSENFLDFRSWVDGSWRWDEPWVKEQVSKIYGDAIGRLAGLGKEHPEIASLIRRTSFAVEDWSFVVPSFLSAFLGVEEIWEELGKDKAPFFILKKIRQEKKNLMQKDMWPYSEKMGDFVQYLPQDSDFKEIIRNLESYKKRYERGYLEFQALENQEKELIKKNPEILFENQEETNFAGGKYGTLFIHMTYYNNDGTDSLLHFYLLRKDAAGTNIDIDNNEISVKQGNVKSGHTLEEAVQLVCTEVLNAERIIINSSVCWEILLFELLKTCNPSFFILIRNKCFKYYGEKKDWTENLYADDSSNLNDGNEVIMSVDELESQVNSDDDFLRGRKNELKEIDGAEWTGKLEDFSKKIVEGELYEEFDKVINQAWEEYLGTSEGKDRTARIYSVVASQKDGSHKNVIFDALNNTFSEVLGRQNGNFSLYAGNHYKNGYQNPSENYSIYDNLSGYFVRQLANVQSGEVVLDPCAGDGENIHRFAYGDDLSSLDTNYIGISPEFHWPVAFLTSLLLNKSVDPLQSIGRILLEEKNNVLPDHDVLIVEQEDDYLYGTELYRDLGCLNFRNDAISLLGKNARGIILFCGDLPQSTEVLTDSLLLIFEITLGIAPGEQEHIFYYDNRRKSSTVNFLRMDYDNKYLYDALTALEKWGVENFSKPLSEFYKYSSDLKMNVDKTERYPIHLWTVPKKDILSKPVKDSNVSGKFIDLAPTSWKPKTEANVLVQSKRSERSAKIFSDKLRSDIEKDLSLLDEIESIEAQMISICMQDKKIKDLFEVHHPNEFYGRRGKFSESEKEHLKNINTMGYGLYGTGFDRVLFAGTPKVLDFPSRPDFDLPGLVIALSKRDKKDKGFFQEEEIKYSDQHYYLSNPTITCPGWSADRSVVAIVPKQKMNSLQLEFFKNWFEVVGQRFIIGLSENFEGLIPLVEVQSIPFVEKEKDMEIINSLVAKLRNLYGRRAKQSINCFRDHAKSIFDSSSQEV